MKEIIPAAALSFLLLANPALGEYDAEEEIGCEFVDRIQRTNQSEYNVDGLQLYVEYFAGSVLNVTVIIRDPDWRDENGRIQVGEIMVNESYDFPTFKAAFCPSAD